MKKPGDKHLHYAEAVKRVELARKVRSSDLTFNGLWFLAELPPLTGLANLQLLALDETQISDLSPIAGLSGLRSLSCRSTPLNNIQPIAQLLNLLHLDLSESRVSDLSPLSRLEKLQCLIIDGCPIHDLQPVAHLTELAFSALGGNPIGGISFRRCPVANPAIASYADMRNPQRTVEVLNVARSIANLPAIPYDIAQVPDLPPQQIGPQFSLQPDGSIGFAHSDNLDRLGNNVAHLNAFHDELRELVCDLVERLKAGNLPYPRLRDCVDKYRRYIDKDLSEVSFPLVYSAGVRIGSAFEATKRQISAGELPRLDLESDEALNSLLSIHALFMASSSEGRSMNDAALGFELTLEEMADLRDAAIQFSEAISTASMVNKDAAEFVLDSAKGLGDGPRPDQSSSSGHSAIRNMAIVLTATGVVGAVAYGAALGPLGIAALLYVTGSLGNEGFKKSKLGQMAGDEIKKAIDRATVEFILKNEPTLRRLAAGRKQFNFLSRALDWLNKAKIDKDK